MNIPATITSLTLVSALFAGIGASAEVYPSGPKQALTIGEDLCATLDAKFQRGLSPEAVVLENLSQPRITALPPEKPGAPGRVAISTGFVDLVNYLAHAKAIDHLEPGYFKSYVAALSQAGSNAHPPAPARLENGRYWSAPVINAQSGLFNQMIGITLALNLSHHYLAQYPKHQAQMADGLPLPINDYLDKSEWEQTVVDATVNSLDCALATDGFKTLCDAIALMPVRPAWADAIVPQGADLKKLERELSRYEQEFFHNDRWLRRRVARGY